MRLQTYKDYYDGCELITKDARINLKDYSSIEIRYDTKEYFVAQLLMAGGGVFYLNKEYHDKVIKSIDLIEKNK